MVSHNLIDREHSRMSGLAIQNLDLRGGTGPRVLLRERDKFRFFALLHSFGYATPACT